MQNILISGSSYIAQFDWPKHIWTNSNITNLSLSGASNKYISDSIINTVDLKNKPDYVFILWTGLNKLDIVLPQSQVTTELAKIHKFVGKINNCYYFFDGGDKVNINVVKSYQAIKDSNWPSITNLVDFFQLDQTLQQECHREEIFAISKFDPTQLQHYLEATFVLQRLYNNSKYFNDCSLSAIANCCTFLDHHKIPYNFGFGLDVFANHADNAFLQGKIDKTNPNFNRISWDRCVKLTPYEFGLKHNLMSYDDFHLTVPGMRQWAEQLKDILQKGNYGKTI